MQSPVSNLICPDCRGDVTRGVRGLTCSSCQRTFLNRDGISHFLPTILENGIDKEKEKAGWASLFIENRDAEYFLSLPYLSSEIDTENYYAHAAAEFDFACSFLGSLENMTGLDLGGSIGWAAYRFAQKGARVALADFNDGPSGLQGASHYVKEVPEIERFRVDAHCLPFASRTFDFVYSSSFLHHMQRPEAVVAEVARILNPGGVYIASCEAFCPFWTSQRKALMRSPVTGNYIDRGINEQVFYQRQYIKWFLNAGLSIKISNPNWDTPHARSIAYGEQLGKSNYQPEILRKRTGSGGLVGVASRAVLGSQLWRLAIPIMKKSELARRLLLSATQKYRILIGVKKPA